jgi:DNA-binding PadR family transcriptional regulator
MPRSAQTETAVLGALSVEPMTGYGVRAAITDTLGHFWRESFGQIYPTLARLEARGLVRRTGPGSTSGTTFALTEAGSARLLELLRQPPEAVPPRNGLLLRLFFGRLLGPAQCRELVGEVLDTATGSLARFEELRKQSAREAADPNAPYWLIAIAAGEHSSRAQRDWAREALAILDGLQPGADASAGVAGGGVPVEVV